MPSLALVPRWAWFLVGGLALFVALMLALDSYGDRRFAEGERVADAKWKAASDNLVEKAAKATTKADKQAAARVADYAAKVEDEKEKIDAAIADGSSPLDALFGS